MRMSRGLAKSGSLKMVFVAAEEDNVSNITDSQTSRIAIGTRFKMSALGAVRCPRLAEKIVGMSRYNTGVTVLFDGNKTATCLHKDYISPVHE